METKKDKLSIVEFICGIFMSFVYIIGSGALFYFPIELEWKVKYTLQFFGILLFCIFGILSIFIGVYMLIMIINEKRFGKEYWVEEHNRKMKELEQKYGIYNQSN